MSGANEAGGFAQDDIALIAQDFCSQIHDLLRAGGNKHVIHLFPDVQTVPQILAYGVAQGGIAFGKVILQRADGIFGKNFSGNLGHFAAGERLGGRIARRKRDVLGDWRSIENLPDSGRLHMAHPFGDNVFHRGTPFFLKNSYILL